ncbi:hypothetical protein HK102_001197 [Quaeritorhiza haematococci]|nr:hypothetical protein HK102_001197 [Quaeritorhiza haematococci]
MGKIGEVYSEQTFSWQISDLIPPDTPYEDDKRYQSPPFDTSDGQRWCLSMDLKKNGIDVFLKIVEPIVATAATVFSLVLTGGIDEFTRESSSWGWKPFVKRDQWRSFLQSSIGVKICLRHVITTDPTRELYSSLVNNKNESDCSFLVQGKRIYALSVILRHQSPYFKAMLESQFAEGSFSKDRPIELPNLTHDAVVSCMNWMYTGRPWPWCETSFLKMRAIYTAADMFGLGKLAERALDVISTTVMITLDTFGDMYVFARTFQQPQLASKALAFWKKNWAKTEADGENASQQAKIIIERMKNSGEDEELWAFAKAALGDESTGAK